MRPHTYEVQKGNEVKAQHVGKNVTWNKAQTIGEALGLPTDVAERISSLISGASKSPNPHFENEAALVAASEQQRDIAVREDIRAILGKDDGTIDAAAKAANELTIGAPRSSDGRVSKKAKPETIAKRAAASSGNKMFQKALENDQFYRQMVKAGVLDEVEFATWREAQSQVAPASAPEPAAATA